MSIKTLLFTRTSFENVLTMNDYIDAVELSHRLHAENNIIETNLVHADVPNGEYHIKTGGLLGDKSYYGLKANGGFFNNRENYNLPNILGVIYLSDASNAYPLAIFESSLISKMRTAAATAVAAKYLQPEESVRLGIVGYGNQAETHIEALKCVCNICSIKISGRNVRKAKVFVDKLQGTLDIPVSYDNIKNTCEDSNILITCTPSTEYLIEDDWVQEGTFVAAIGADSPGKNELHPMLMRKAKIVADIKKQVVKVGESQHAINQGLISDDDIYCELGDLVTKKKKGRTNSTDIFIYDSTGTAIQDISTAAYIYEKFKNDDSIKSIDFFE